MDAKCPIIFPFSKQDECCRTLGVMSTVTHSSLGLILGAVPARSPYLIGLSQGGYIYIVQS